MYFHSQNLNNKAKGINGSMWRTGRCWLHWGNAGRRDRSIGFDWSLFPRHHHTLGVVLGLGHYDCALSFHLSLIFMHFYLNLNHGPLESYIQEKTKRKEDKYGGGREIGITIHSGEIFVSLWEDPMSWGSKDPRWWRFSIHPIDILFGDKKHNERVLEDNIPIAVTMPEKTYKGKVKLSFETWKRPRLFWNSDEICRAHIDMIEPIPVPGKGTCEWNCGEEAIYSLTCPANSVAEAIAKITEDTLKTRERYGGRNWMPEAIRS